MMFASEPRRAAEQDVVKRLAPRLCRGDENAEVLLDPVLPHEVLKPDRPQASVKLDVVVFVLFRSNNSLRQRSSSVF